MSDFFYRTEEIRMDEIKDYFVETHEDRVIIDQLKARNPVVLIGSRGVGKSFLFRIAQAELIEDLSTTKTLPVYLTFRRSSLIHTANDAQFHYWMLSRLCHETLRAFSKLGLLTSVPQSFNMLSGDVATNVFEKTKIELISEKFENSWRNPGESVDVSAIPTVDNFLEAIEDMCQAIGIKRVVIFIDEAAHIFLPEQQRQFFTLFRDLRSPFLTCNAAVYPGVTSFGDTFQPIHDASLINLNRNIHDEKYVHSMREIVIKQTEDSSFVRSIAKRGENFALLAYASNGNPRHLLKTVNLAQKLDGESVNNTIREYYRADIWSEHSGLADKYPGHRAMVDWGRKFVETEVLPELKQKNSSYLSQDKKTTCYFWMHRDIPQPVKESLRLLEYTGIVTEQASGIKASRSEIGTRYSVNLGCLISLEATPTQFGFDIAKNTTPKRMSEFGINHRAFETLISEVPKFIESDNSGVLSRQLKKPLSVLDLTKWQIERLESLKLYTIGDVLKASESKLQEAYYVGEKKARRMRNVAIASVYEYLSG